MYSSESDSAVVSEDDEEGKIYQWIFDMIKTDDREEEKEEVQLPSSSGNTPVHLETDAETSPHAVAEGLDVDALHNIQEIPVPKKNAEEKPWRKADADISDYFNYGFDEKSWNTYCKKQAKVCAASRKLYTKLMTKHTEHEEGECCSAYSSSGTSSVRASRWSSSSTDVTGGRRRSNGRVERCRCLSDEENSAQVFTEMSPEEDRFTCCHLTSPINLNYPFAYIPPPPFLYRPAAPPPPSSRDTLDSGKSKDVDDRSTSQHLYSSGVSTFLPRSMVSNAGVINTAKAWECYICREKCEKDRHRSSKHGHDGGRDRDKERHFSSHSEKASRFISSKHKKYTACRGERTRHRDTTERGHKRHSLTKVRGDKEKQRRERRHGHNSQGCSGSRSRRGRGEHRDSQSRRKKKNAKRNRKDKETSKMFSADQERKLKSD